MWSRQYAKSRESKRSIQQAQAKQIIQKMVYLFHSEAIRSLLSGYAINSTKYASSNPGSSITISGTGNLEVNLAKAEEKLLSISVLNDRDFIEYVAQFKRAVKDLNCWGKIGQFRS